MRQHSTHRKTPENCPWREVLTHDGGEPAHCRFLQQLLRSGDENLYSVTRDICMACCSAFPPTFETLNPVLASLVFDRAGSHARAATEAAEMQRWQSLRQWAEQYLEVETQTRPDDAPATSRKSLPDSARPLRELLPLTARCGSKVQHWSVGVTTAPRRRSYLDDCLHSLANAGWPRPHLFIDGAMEVPCEWSHLPATRREEQVGAWPNYYLSLLELLMREPLADAFMIVQDDALFYCQESLRQYLEEILWPGKSLGVVSLYCASPDTQPEPRWSEYSGRWKYGAVALIFPRTIAQRLVVAPSVFRHRWAEGDEGRARIPDVISDWAVATSTPFYYPSPSLVQHIGETSAIWSGAYELTPARRARRLPDDECS